MGTLVLIRHAKAVDADPRGDHERALAPRGRADAQKLGAWLHRHGLTPDLVLVSTAARAQQTLESLLVGVAAEAGEEVAGEDIETWTTRQIYDGGVDGVLQAVREAPGTSEVLWVVGHEPVMSTTAWDLAEASSVPHEVTSTLATGFPTSSAAVLTVADPWSELAFGGGQLVRVHTSRA